MSTESLDKQKDIEVFAVETESQRSNSEITSETLKTQKKSGFKAFLWDTLDKSPEEKRRICKLDLTLLTFCTLSTFIKYLDKQNLTNAFVSGMKEELSLYGNEMNYANVVSNIITIIWGLPGGIILAKTNAKWFIMTLEFGWTLFTFCFAAIQNSTQMIALRAVVSLFEMNHFGAVIYVMGSWYTKEQLARRVVLVQAATAIGPMFSGYLQTAAYTGLEGVGGLSGWRWLFIIDGVISAGIIILQLLVFPDVLKNQKPNKIFNEADIRYFREANNTDAIDKDKKEIKEKTKLFLSVGKDLILNWKIWALWFIGVSENTADLSKSAISYWLKGWNSYKPGSYTVSQINNIPTVTYAIQFVIAISCGWISDTLLKGKRWPPIVVAGIWTFVSCACLAELPIYDYHTRAARMFFYFQTSFCIGTSGLFWSWIQETFQNDSLLRAFACGGVNVWMNVVGCIIEPIWFQTSKQPFVQTGHWISGVFALFYGLAAFALGFWEIKQRRSIRYETT